MNEYARRWLSKHIKRNEANRDLNEEKIETSAWTNILCLINCGPKSHQIELFNRNEWQGWDSTENEKIKNEKKKQVKIISWMESNLVTDILLYNRIKKTTTTKQCT